VNFMRTHSRMAELYEKVSNLGNYVSNAIPASVNAAGTSRTMILVYVLFAGLIIAAVVMMLMGKKIEFSALDPRPKYMIVRSTSKLFWPPGPFFTNLIVPVGSNGADFMDNSYSLIFDAVLYNTRSYRTTGGPWRQILHRGSDELKATTIGGAVLRGCAASGTSGPLPPFGLPRRMNPGIFLDPNINDIIIFVDSDRGSESYRESVRLVDIPMDIPFRIGINLKGQVLEVYLNCKLEITKVLAGTPKKVEDTWYGLAGSAAAEAQIQNLYIWKTPLTADQMGAICVPQPPVFMKKRPICDAADSVTSAPAPPAKAGTNISYGNALKC
jgi:hypothetical protein